MSYSIELERTYQQLTPQPVQDSIDQIKAEWQDVSYKDVLISVAQAQQFEPTENTSRAIVVMPETADVDTDNAIALMLPHMNGWTPHHYIRAKVMQQLVAPNSPVVVLPNGLQDYDLTQLDESQRMLMETGFIHPLAKQQLKTLEVVGKSMSLGSMALTGYSLGGRLSLSMAAHKDSFDLDIKRVNADEVPSKSGRSAADLERDFLKSGTLLDLPKAIKESEIPALRSAMRKDRLAKDLVKFGLVNKLNPHAKLMHKAMTMSAGFDASNAHAAKDIESIKVGYVENSKIFDPVSFTAQTLWELDTESTLVKYVGPEFHGHPSADNVIVHALMVNDGLNQGN